MSLNLASLNARGLRCRGRAARTLRNLLQLDIDVCALQETHFTESRDERVFAGDFHVFSSYGTYQGRGVSLLVKRSLNAVVDVLFTDTDGRLVVADLKVDNSRFRVVSVYAPNTALERRSFFPTAGAFFGRSETLDSNG